MNITKLWVYLSAFICTCLISTANATVFSIDNFAVYRDGNPFFEDTFSDGIPPPSTEGTFPDGSPGMYGTVGSPGPETGGKLALDTALGNAQPSDVTGTSLLVQRSRLLTATNNDNPNRGLKINHQIAVLGTFDLIAPELLLERYGVRLTDFKTDYAFNDNVSMDVQRESTGEVRVALREADFDLHTENVLGQTILTESDFLNYNQIVLGLFHDADSQQVYGGYSLIGDSGATEFMYFDQTANIFDGEEWTRASFIATQVVVAEVPESTSIMLLLSGLLAMGWMRRLT